MPLLVVDLDQNNVKENHFIHLVEDTRLLYALKVGPCAALQAGILVSRATNRALEIKEEQGCESLTRCVNV